MLDGDLCLSPIKEDVEVNVFEAVGHWGLH